MKRYFIADVLSLGSIEICQPEIHDKYPLYHFLVAPNVKAFPKFQMTTNSLRFLESLALGDVVG